MASNEVNTNHTPKPEVIDLRTNNFIFKKLTATPEQIVHTGVDLRFLVFLNFFVVFFVFALVFVFFNVFYMHCLHNLGTERIPSSKSISTQAHSAHFQSFSKSTKDRILPSLGEERLYTSWHDAN